MKTLKGLLLSVIFITACITGGCLNVQSHERAMSKREKEQFAEMVAKKVVEYQKMDAGQVEDDKK